MKSRVIEISVGGRAESLVLPVNPEKITVTGGQKNQTIDLLEMGEVLSLGNRALSEFSFSGFFPGPLSPFYRYADRGPLDYYGTLERWKLDKQVVRVIIGCSSVNMAVAIEKLTQEIHEGDGDLYYSIDFKEYRRLNVPLVQGSRVQQASGLLDRPDMLAMPGSVLVTSPAETFWYLACKYYGDGTKWKMLATANGCELAYDTRVGMVVTLP